MKDGNFELKNIIKLFLNIFILYFFSFGILYWISRDGIYPWGSDTYGHIFKANELYNEFLNGGYYLNYSGKWYNGLQPFRYWAPLPYYIIALINLLSKNTIVAYNYFILLCFLIAGLGWLILGYRLNRNGLALFISLMWFFVPNNLRILFSEGNLPYATVNAFIPYVFLFCISALNEKRIRDYIGLCFIMSIITLSHAMLAAMIFVSIFIFIIVDAFINKDYINNLFLMIHAMLGISITSFWLYPALRGGLMNMDKEAVASVMSALSYPITVSLNPILRLTNREIYYFGLAFAIIAMMGMFFSKNKERPYFITGSIIFLGTTKLVLPILQKLPLNQLFWMSRFTSIALCFILAGYIGWVSLRKPLVWLFLLIMMIDSYFSFTKLCFDVNFPKNLAQSIDDTLKYTKNRTAVMDLSSYGSFPSYYLSYNGQKNVFQNFGWSWQGAATAQNIVMLNTALENQYFDFMFDRTMELGSDTVMVRKRYVKDQYALDKAAKKLEYFKRLENSDYIVYSLDRFGDFGTKVNYEGLAIGKFSFNIVYLFPKFQVGKSMYIDDYNFEELKKYKSIYLSGFKYKNKETAENILQELGKAGVNIVIDMMGDYIDKFLGVSSQPINFEGRYPKIIYKGKVLNQTPFPSDLKDWRTVYLNGLVNEYSYSVNENKILQYIGKKSEVTFLGFNLIYYTFFTKNTDNISMLEDIFNMRAYDVPNRSLINMQLKIAGNTVVINSTKGTIAPIAAIDAFQKVEGDYEVDENLIKLKTDRVILNVGYPGTKTGLLISFISLALLICIVYIMKSNILSKV